MIYVTEEGEEIEPAEVQREKYHNHWVVRNVGSKHICNNLNLFSNFQRGNFGNYSDPYGSTPIEGKGSVTLNVKDIDGNVVILKLREVLYIPNWNRNQLSIFALKDYTFELSDMSKLRIGTTIFPISPNERKVPVMTTLDLVEINA